MKLNVKLLEKVKERILAEPAQFAMSSWFSTTFDPDKGQVGLDDIPRDKIPNCGTAACIGGWAVTLGRKWPKGKPSNASIRFEIEDARKLLGLPSERHDDNDGGDLFYVTWWPAKYQDAWREAKTLRQRARVAARRIDAYIKEHAGR